MAVLLLPRLDRVSVDNCLAEPDTLTRPIRAGLRTEDLPAGTTFAASGGTRCDMEDLMALRTRIVEVATQRGFPGAGSIKARAQFDELVAVELIQLPLFHSGEGLRDDVWAFIATVVLPDVVSWRFAGRPAERFHGGIRNTFQRLWMRALVLDRGSAAEDRWGLLKSLGEDALVGITERTSIGSDAVLARAFAEAWVRAAAVTSRGAMEDLTRRAVIRLRLRNQVQMLSRLDDTSLSQLMDGFFTGNGEQGDETKPGWIKRMFN